MLVTWHRKDCEVSGSKRYAIRHTCSLYMTGSQGCEGQRSDEAVGARLVDAMDILGSYNSRLRGP